MRPLTRNRLLGAVLTATALPLLTPPAAQAIPEDGASADTPGTSASVSPTRLSAGSVLSFRIHGFPAGEVVSVKVDDGLFCSASGVHGACVVHQQRISSAGTASGSFVLPSDLKVGTHWLRFLASREAHDADGTYLGTQGFTLRGRSTFTIVAPDRSSGTAAQPSASGSGGNADSVPVQAVPGSTDGTTTPTVPGNTPGASESSAPVGVATPGAEITLQFDSAAVPASTPSQPSSSASVAPSAPSSASAQPAQALATSGADTREIPWLGLVGGGAATVLAAGLLCWPRRRSAR